MFTLVVVNRGSACATGGVVNHTLPPGQVSASAGPFDELGNYFLEYTIF